MNWANLVVFHSSVTSLLSSRPSSDSSCLCLPLVLCDVSCSCSSLSPGRTSICPLLEPLLAALLTSCPATVNRSTPPESGKVCSSLSGSLYNAGVTQLRGAAPPQRPPSPCVFCPVVRVQRAGARDGGGCAWSASAPELHRCTRQHQRHEGSESAVLDLCGQHDHPVWPARTNKHIRDTTQQVKSSQLSVVWETRLKFSWSP